MHQKTPKSTTDPPELVHYSDHMMQNEVVKKHQKAQQSSELSW